MRGSTGRLGTDQRAEQVFLPLTEAMLPAVAKVGNVGLLIFVIRLLALTFDHSQHTLPKIFVGCALAKHLACIILE